MKRIETKKIALSSLLCALATVFSVVGCILDIADLVAVTAASVLVSIAGSELGKKYQLLIYAVTSFLLLCLFPASTVTLYFILFFGYYPIVRGLLAKLPVIPMWVLKYIMFNAAIVCAYFLMTKILITAEAETDMLMVAVLWIFSNAFFAVYDIALNVFTTAYILHYRKKWGIDKFMLY